MLDYENYFGDLTEEEYIEQTKEHIKWLIDNSILNLVEKFSIKHPLAKECGSEYIYQNDRAQVDAIGLVSDIFDLYVNYL